ncbi:hypothetical protein [Allorhizocola rhizosphaerae]|uniref:hypothetical protein n=1 Tax=Allorhizocola rhizosphaerae TaxID=1872709 RepID=UPI000E3C851B|nr:hypothetical protein [Allorhizocola rhizosphaerae]
MKTKAKLAAITVAAMTLAMPHSAGAAAPIGDSTTRLSVAEPVPGGFTSWTELFELQGRMNDAAAEIRSMAGHDAASGFGAIVAAPENRELRVYWRGPVPGDIQAVLDKRREQVPIAVVQARFTQADLLAEAQRLSQFPEFAEVAPIEGAQGLRISRRAGHGVSERAAQAVVASSVAVEMGEDWAGRQFMASRQDDSPAYNSGGLTRRQDGVWQCTTGFGVIHSGRAKLLHAAHCYAWSVPVYDGGMDLIGGAYSHVYSRDIALIDGPSLARMFDGPYNSSAYKLVQSASFSEIGNWLCTSGAVSGVRCGIQVINNNVYISGDGPFVAARKNDGTNAAGSGDSGGPVFELPNPDNGKVIAKGILSAGMPAYVVPCTGMPVARTCYSRVWYADVTQTLAYYGATLITG